MFHTAVRQRMYVMNCHMKNCQAWVAGSIFIGGVGVAHGHLSSEKLFRITGDLLRHVRSEGLIEIMGREVQNRAER
eukprot:gene8559-10897_t